MAIVLKAFIFAAIPTAQWLSAWYAEAAVEEAPLPVAKGWLQNAARKVPLGRYVPMHFCILNSWPTRRICKAIRVSNSCHRMPPHHTLWCIIALSSCCIAHLLGTCRYFCNAAAAAAATAAAAAAAARQDHYCNDNTFQCCT